MSFRRNNITNAIVHLLWTGIIATATSFIATKAFYPEILLAILPVGLISSGITHGHGKVAAYSYAFEIMSTYAYVAIMTFVGILHRNNVKAGRYHPALILGNPL